MTIGFNDRPGFRLGAAMEINPWDQETREAMKIRVIPMVLMDSHVHDYSNFSDKLMAEEIQKWCRLTHQSFGTASVIWHQRVISNDYGWRHSWKVALQEVTRDTKPLP